MLFRWWLGEACGILNSIFELDKRSGVGVFILGYGYLFTVDDLFKLF